MGISGVTLKRIIPGRFFLVSVTSNLNKKWHINRLVLNEHIRSCSPLGDDEQSKQMLSSWEDEQVAELTNNRFVAIKVDAKRWWIPDAFSARGVSFFIPHTRDLCRFQCEIEYFCLLQWDVCPVLTDLYPFWNYSFAIMLMTVDYRLWSWCIRCRHV